MKRSAAVGSADGKAKVITPASPKPASKSESKRESRKKKLETQMKRNLKPLLFSAALSMLFAAISIFAFIKLMPLGWRYVAASILEFAQWYKSSELLATDISEERVLRALPTPLTLTEFRDNHQFQSPVLMGHNPGLTPRQYEHMQSLLQGNPGGATLDAAAGVAVDVLTSSSGATAGKTTTTLDAFILQGQLAHELHTQQCESSGAAAEAEDLEDDGADVLLPTEQALSKVSPRKNSRNNNSIPGEVYYVEISSEHPLHAQCGLDLTLARPMLGSYSGSGSQSLLLSTYGNGPSFVSGKNEFWVESIYGEVQWMLFHPHALPTIGYGEDQPFSEWIEQVYPSLTARDAPTIVNQMPGETLYIPEGWTYAYRSVSPVAAAVKHSSSVSSVGSHVHCLEEGTRRLQLGDLLGAKKLFVQGIDLCVSRGGLITRALDFVAGLTGRAGPEGRSGVGKGRVPISLLHALGDVNERLGIWAEAEQAYRDAVSFNTKHSTSYFLFANAVIEGAKASALLELDKNNVGRKTQKQCSESLVRDMFLEAGSKLRAAMNLASVALNKESTLLADFETICNKALNGLLLPHKASGLYCDIVLIDRSEL